MLTDPGFWVAVGFVGFAAILIYFKIPKIVTKMLDQRADKIQKKIDEASKIKHDAQKLLNEYQKKQRDAQKEIINIKDEAKNIAKKQAEKLKQNNEKNLALIKITAEKRIEQIYADALIEQKKKTTMIVVNAVSVIFEQNYRNIDQKTLLKDSIEEMQKTL